MADLWGRFAACKPPEETYETGADLADERREKEAQVAKEEMVKYVADAVKEEILKLDLDKLIEKHAIKVCKDGFAVIEERATDVCKEGGAVLEAAFDKSLAVFADEVNDKMVAFKVCVDAAGANIEEVRVEIMEGVQTVMHENCNAMYESMEVARLVYEDLGKRLNMLAKG